jgi:hypothetical protein
MSKADIISIAVPIRVRSSHGIAERGFSSSVRSHFSSRLPGDVICWEPHFSGAGLTILGVAVSSIAVGAPENGEQRLVVSFAEPQTEESADRFLQDLAVGLSLSIAPQQKDGAHGILFVEIPLADVGHDKLPSAGGRIRVTDAVSIETLSPQPLSGAILEALRPSPLAEIFVDGMKAPDAKAKYIHWFVMLEELERCAEFDELFERVFSPAQVGVLATSGSMSTIQTDRFRSWAGGRNLTVEGRVEKLRRILEKIGVTEINTIQGSVAITTDLVKSLITQRNKVAHRGSGIDGAAVYTVLFPLAYAALNYLMDREEMS